MLVVGILGVVLAMGIPPMARVLKREPVRQAASDIERALRAARAAAILKSADAEMIIGLDMENREIVLEVALVSDGEKADTPLANPAGKEETNGGADAATAQAPFQRVSLPAGVRITRLDVNGLNQLQSRAEDIRVQFHPNGTADGFAVRLEDGPEAWEVTVDPVTGYADWRLSR
jgi:type II secretory pathway pseudopilin PulG